jgi:2,4-dienoyl-CoA reductase-like NADH-dependent reductase (Old Yellow Enzyme family)
MDQGFYRGSACISPHRQASKSYGGLTATKMTTRELAQDVQDAVDHDFTLHYRVTDTEQFLDRLLPVQMATCDTILQYMMEKALYDSDTQRWRGYPDPHKESDQGSGPKRKKKKLKENLLYGPFCATAEAIREFVEKQRPTALQMGDTKWMDYHSKSPRSEDSQAARLRPDALFAFQVIADQTVWKECQVRVLF